MLNPRAIAVIAAALACCSAATRARDATPSHFGAAKEVRDLRRRPLVPSPALSLAAKPRLPCAAFRGLRDLTPT